MSSDASPPSPYLPGCYVCGADAGLRCSGDKEADIWPVHKWLCGKDPSFFIFPPLSREEVQRVDDLRDEFFLESPQKYRPLIDYLRDPKALCFPHDWRQYLTIISVSYDKLPPSYPLWYYNWLVLHAHCHIFNHALPGISVAHTPWRLAAPTAVAYAQSAPRDEDLVSFFTDFNRFLRHELVFNAVVCLRLQKDLPSALPSALTIELCEAVHRRSVEAFELAEVEPRLEGWKEKNVRMLKADPKAAMLAEGDMHIPALFTARALELKK
ncbi:hypothetical protein JCM6882_001998 [Rhodosporidiobolus microsporus]